MELQDPQLSLDRLIRQDLRNDPEQAVWILATARHEALVAMREAKTEEDAQSWRAYSVKIGDELLNRHEWECVQIEAAGKEEDRRFHGAAKELLEACDMLREAIRARPAEMLGRIAVVLTPLLMGGYLVWSFLARAVR
jgi:hypothetical protein